jgi:hypothetical protein
MTGASALKPIPRWVGVTLMLLIALIVVGAIVTISVGKR